ncbi:MAG: hypothetical protein WC119_01810 [Synergistaceae bacterium]
MSIELIADGIIDLIKKNIIAKTNVVSDVSTGDILVNVEDAYRFHDGEEIVLIDWGYNDPDSIHYNSFEYAKIKEVNNTTSITLTDPIISNWTVSDRSSVQKTIGHSPLYVDNVLYGDRDVIPVEDIAITVEPSNLSNEWIYLQGGLSEEYRVRIMIYGKSILSDEGRRILDRYSWAVYSLLNNNIHIDVNNYETPLLNDYASGSTTLVVADTPANRENFIVSAETSEYQLQDNLKRSCGFGWFKITNVYASGGHLHITINPTVSDDFYLSEYAVLRRMGEYIYDSRAEGIEYGKVSKGSAFLRAAEISWFGKKVNRHYFPQTSDGVDDFTRIPEGSSSSSSSSSIDSSSSSWGESSSSSLDSSSSSSSFGKSSSSSSIGKSSSSSSEGFSQSESSSSSIGESSSSSSFGESSSSSADSSSSTSSEHGGIVSDPYWNDNRSIITIDYRGHSDFTYNWDGGSYVIPDDGRADITKYCYRILIYQNVYHNGSTYILPVNPDYILAPYQAGLDVPNEEPFVNDAWNYYQYNNFWSDLPGFIPNYAKLGGNKSFDVNADNLFQNLMVAHGIPISAGVLHDVAIECMITKLCHGKIIPYVVTDADVLMTARAYGDITEVSSSSSDLSSESSFGYSSSSSESAAVGTIAFAYTGADQSFIVPAGVTSITTKVWGAGVLNPLAGGAGAGVLGGAGGYSKGILAVTPGETLTIIVGEGGQYNTASYNAYGGGGSVAAGDPRYSGGGGGRSAIRRGSTELVTAGGGGGGVDYIGVALQRYAGEGGGNTGLNGWDIVKQGGSYAGKGGTLIAGGAAGSGGGQAGSAYTGGNSTSVNFGGAGGGGYYGGGGGGWTGGNQGTGGGGSGYIGSLTDAITLAGIDGVPPSVADSDYVAGVGIGGGTTSDGGNGLVVISYPPETPVINTNKIIVSGAGTSYANGEYTWTEGISLPPWYGIAGTTNAYIATISGRYMILWYNGTVDSKWYLDESYVANVYRSATSDVLGSYTAIGVGSNPAPTLAYGSV